MRYMTDLIPRCKKKMKDRGVLLAHKLLHKLLVLFFDQILAPAGKTEQLGLAKIVQGYVSDTHLTRARLV